MDLSSAECRVDGAKSSAISHIVVDRTQVGAIEHIQEVKPELQVPLLTRPWNLIVLEHARIHLEITGVAINVSRQVSFPGECRHRKVGLSEYATLELLTAMGAGEVRCRPIRNVIGQAIVVIVTRVHGRRQRVCIDYPKWGAALNRRNTG